MIRTEHLSDSVTLHLGDCREVLPTLARADAVLTDPPYGIGIAANPVRQRHEKMDWDDAPPDADLIALVRAAAPLSIIWGGNYFDLPPSQCFLIWDKVQPEQFSLAMCEKAWTNMAKPAKMFKRHVVSFEKHHPSQKPIELMRWCILQLPTETRTILDPFMGSGTTGCAAVQMGRRFIGIEREPTYYDVARRRISDALSRPDLFIEPPARAARTEQPVGLFDTTGS